MRYTISKRFRFSASHRLTDLPPDDPCSRVHGHNYEVVLTLGSDTLDDHGMVMNFHALRPFKDLVDRLDHNHLNDVLPTHLGSPTAERLAHLLLDLATEVFSLSPGGAPLDPEVPHPRVLRLRLYETPDSWVEVSA